MVEMVFGLLSMLVAWLVSHLPVSPFQQLTFADVEGFGQYTMHDILGWINWLIPFRSMLQFFSLWLAALLTSSAVMFVCRYVIKLGTGGVVDVQVEHLS